MEIAELRIFWPPCFEKRILGFESLNFDPEATSLTVKPGCNKKAKLN